MTTTPIMAYTDQAAALQQMLTALSEYQTSAGLFVSAKARWTNQECKGSRIRNEAVAANKLAGMKVTEADARASEFPAYAAHRDELARLQNELTEAETNMQVARARYEGAKEVHSAIGASKGLQAAAEMSAGFREFAGAVKTIEGRT